MGLRGGDPMPKDKNANKLIAQNKKAYHDYFVEDTFQAGIELAGTEVKSLRAGKCNLRDSYIVIENGEALIEGMHISPYEFGNMLNKDPVRKRRLLLHKQEIDKLRKASTQNGYTIVPLKIYFQKSWVKVDVALAKGKKLYDKRETIAKKDQMRSAEKEFKIRNLH
jgi:SsrA-binding protein